MEFERTKIRPPRSEAQAVSEVYQQLKRGAERIGRDFTHPEDDWRAMWLLVTRKEGVLFTGDMHKYDLAEAAGALGRRLGAVAIGHLSSSWLLMLEGLSPERHAEIDAHVNAGGSFEDLPERVEAVMIQALSATISQLYTATITRYPDRPPELGPFKRAPTGEMSGAMVDPLREGLVRLG